MFRVLRSGSEPALRMGNRERSDIWQRRATWSALAAAALALIAFDHAVPEVGMGPLYIPLIALAGWQLGPSAACLVAVGAALLNIFPYHVQEPGLAPAIAVARAFLRLGTYAFVVAAVCALRRLYDRERIAARHDALTGALNRSAFEERARAMLSTKHPRGSVVVLALADLDGFKRVNDSGGHAAGDAVLCAFASLADSALGERDYIGRLGGDEFVFLLAASSLSDSRVRVETLHQRLGLGLQQLPTSVTVSIGALVLRPGACPEWPAALREADRLMYAVKAAGKGAHRVEFADILPSPERLQVSTTIDRFAA